MHEKSHKNQLSKISEFHNSTSSSMRIQNYLQSQKAKQFSSLIECQLIKIWIAAHLFLRNDKDHSKKADIFISIIISLAREENRSVSWLLKKKINLPKIDI